MINNFVVIWFSSLFAIWTTTILCYSLGKTILYIKFKISANLIYRHFLLTSSKDQKLK